MTIETDAEKSLNRRGDRSDVRFFKARNPGYPQGHGLVVVVPVLVSRGSVSDVKIPNDLAGLPIEYSGEGLLPHTGLARWIEARVKTAAVAQK